MIEYPKALYRGVDPDACLSDCLTVQDAAQEAAARKDGYEMYYEIHAHGGKPVAPVDAPVAPAKRAYNRKAN